MVTAAQGRQGTAGTDREAIQERGGRRLDGGSVGGCVGDDDEDVLDPSVASLVLDTAELGLDVVDPGLGLGRDHAVPTFGTETTNDAIPRSQIVRDRQRHLESEGQIRMQTSAEARQQRRLARVADRIRSRIGANPDIQADDGSDPAQLDSRDGLVSRPLDPPDLGTR